MLTPLIRAAAVLLLLSSAGSAHAVEVTASREHLGGDRWLYSYELDAFPHTTGYGFTVYFDPEQYAALTPAAAPAPGSDWDAVVLQPDPGLGAEGYYDAQALFDDSTVDTVFRVSFDWFGIGLPGPQPFEVREPAPSFEVVESGMTIVPEPAALAQHAGTLLSLAAMAARGRSRC